jgi:hypothetical protein
MCGLAKEGERWIIIRKKEIKDTFQEANTVKLMKSRQRGWCCLERLPNKEKRKTN